MRHVLQPVGPLPASVYWRRRALACAGLLLVLGLLAWAVGGSSAETDTTAAGPAPVPTVSTASPAAQAGPTGLAAPPGGTAAGALGGTALGPVPDAQARSAAPGAAPAPPPAPCTAAAVRISGRTDAPSYASGTQPQLSLVVTNVGTVACTEDLDATRQALAVVRTPGDGLWSSLDCETPEHTNDVRTLAPGQEAVFTTKWSVRTSTPGCTAPRQRVAPGAYQLLTRLDSTISDPVPFILR